MALALALFEFFLLLSGSRDGGNVWTGFTLAWIALVYLSFQLLTIPLAVGGRDRFIGVVDGMASVVPFGVSLVAIFGKPELLGTTTVGGGIPSLRDSCCRPLWWLYVQHCFEPANHGSSRSCNLTTETRNLGVLSTPPEAVSSWPRR
jgi:hypothetical protein